MRQKRANPGPEQAVAELAARQHGVISLAQLTAAGISVDGVSRRLRAGRLHRIHRGIYAVGHPALSRHGRWLAAVLACGDGAALSHTDAGALWLLLPPENHRPIHVTVAGDGGRRRRDGIVLHRSLTLTPADVLRRHGIPVTRPARTLADLRRVLTRERVEAAVDRARGLGLAVDELGRRQEPARSTLERRFLALCRRHRLPPPEVNVRVGPFLVDFVWRQHRLIAEADGFEHHRSRASFEADRARDAQLQLMGYDVVRFTYRQISEEPDRVARIVASLLSANPAPGRSEQPSAATLRRPNGPPAKQPGAPPSPPPAGGVALGGAIAANEGSNSVSQRRRKAHER